MTTKTCVWPHDKTCLPDNPDPDVLDHVLDAAVGVLWALTGRAYGLCLVEARPCPPGTTKRSGVLSPSMGWDQPADVDCFSVPCGRDGVIVLPGPVYEVIQVVVDGAVVDGAVQVYGDRIYRTAGGAWPAQNLSLPTTMPGTWSILYRRGRPVPAGGGRMVSLLAREFYAACTGGRCQLPRRTQQVQRQGVTVTMVDPQDIYATGATGLSEVDLWVRAHNPNRMVEQSTAWSPDMGVWG